jgi:hypothetical protein
MLEWLFNISIISLLIILILHYAFDFFTPNKSIVDLRVQKYKNIIDTMVQQQKETEFKKAYQEETGDSLEDDGLEELELYLGQTYGFS